MFTSIFECFAHIACGQELSVCFGVDVKRAYIEVMLDLARVCLEFAPSPAFPPSRISLVPAGSMCGSSIPRRPTLLASCPLSRFCCQKSIADIGSSTVRTEIADPRIKHPEDGSIAIKNKNPMLIDQVCPPPLLHQSVPIIEDRSAAKTISHGRVARSLEDTQHLLPSVGVHLAVFTSGSDVAGS